MKDGIVIMYNLEGTIYPVAINQEQYDTIQFLVGNLLSPIRIIKDKPQGKATNLLNKENADE